MNRLHARPLAVHLCPRVTLIQLDVCDSASKGDGDAPLATALEALEDIVLDVSDLCRVVILAGLQHGARRGNRVASALDLHRVEERSIGDVVGRIDFGLQQIAWLEIDEAVRPGPNRLEVVRRRPRPGASIWLEDMPRDDIAGHEPIRSGLGEDNLHRVRVERLHLLDVAVDAEIRRSGGRVGRVFPVEHHVPCGEWLAVVPFYSSLQLPCDRCPVLRHATVLDARNFLGQHRYHVPRGIERHQLLVE